MRHLLRYGTNAWQKHFHLNGSENLYDAMVINANMIAFSPDTISTFIVKKTVKKPFFIDPITHAFQHNQSFICDSSGKKIKKSISKLILAYWDCLKDKICIEDNKDLLPNKRLEITDIDDSFINSFTENVLKFQKEVSKSKKADDYKWYIEYVNQEDPSLNIDMELKPTLLVAPYFYLDINWLDINIKLVNKAKELEPTEKIFAQIVLDKKIIERAAMGDDKVFKSIISAYKKSSADWFLIWIDNYSEHDEVSVSLEKYVEFVRDLKDDSNKEIISLYWSYFSIILTKLGILNWVCHWLEYGESRAVIPVWGGIPTAKFYFYPLHKRINESEMFRFLSTSWTQNFINDVCDCGICNNLMNPYSIENFSMNFWNTETSVTKSRSGFITRHYPSTTTKENSLKHYLCMKKKEFDFIDWNDLQQIKTQLEESSDKYDKYFNQNDISHLSEWKKAIENF